MMRLVRCPSSSAIKLDAIREALAIVWPGERFDVQGKAVELQENVNEVTAQPDGRGETTQFAGMRWRAMCQQHPTDTVYLDISIESGAIDGKDVAVALIYIPGAGSKTVFSRAINFPEGTLEAARAIGFKTTTAGDIIHQKWPHIPSNDWHGHFPPYISRKEQIREAIVEGLRGIPLW